MTTALLLVAFGAVGVMLGRDGSPGWQLTRVGAVVVLAAVAMKGLGRLGERGRGWVSAIVGSVVLATGVGFLPYLVKETASIEALAGLTAVVVGLALVVSGTRARTRGRRGLRRVGAALGALIAVVLVTFVVGPSVAATNVPRTEIGATPDSLDLSYQDVTVTTTDGVDLAGWYMPSRNRAALVLLHGAGSTRSNVLAEAAALVRHGFGVLLIDARGHGESGGRAMDFGWHGDADIAAATKYLATRGEVDRDRIGVVGSSMGGEEAIGASGSNDLIRAVVAEGATARTADDKGWLSDEYGVRGLLQEQIERAQCWVTDILTSAAVPTSLRTAVARSGDVPYLIITAGDVAEEAHAAAYIAAVAPDRVQTWNVAGAAHTHGLAVAPDEWEARVTSFLADALGVRAEPIP